MFRISGSLITCAIMFSVRHNLRCYLYDCVKTVCAEPWVLDYGVEPYTGHDDCVVSIAYKQLPGFKELERVLYRIHLQYPGVLVYSSMATYDTRIRRLSYYVWSTHSETIGLCYRTYRSDELDMTNASQFMFTASRLLLGTYDFDIEYRLSAELCALFKDIEPEEL